MKKQINKVLKNQKGATESVLVTLFFVIIGVGAIIGISSWFSSEEAEMRTTVSQKVDTVKSAIE